MSRRARLYLGGAIAFGVLVYMIFSGFGAGSVYFYTVEEFIQEVSGGRTSEGEFVRVFGIVSPGTVEWRPEGPELKFVLAHIDELSTEGSMAGILGPSTAMAAEQTGGAGSGEPAGAGPRGGGGSPDTTAIPVVYNRVKPDLLADDVEVVVEGTLVDGVFQARKVLVKCPSKYEAELE